MNENWYGSNASSGWYAPLESKETKPEKKAGTKKRRTLWRTVGAVCILLALIVGTSLAFSGSEPSETAETPETEFPDDWQDFFKDFYSSVKTEKAEIDIPVFEYDGKFETVLKAPAEEELDLQTLYQKCSKSIVGISGYKDDSLGYSWGTGVIISEDGLILTNTHVIDGCDKATVTLHDDSEYDALLVGADSISDIAVLKIYAHGLPAAEFGDSAKLSVGDKVAAIGNPLGTEFRLTLTDGIISAIERGVSYNGHSMNLLQTNTAINEGNSGGALFNMYGQVIGITNMKMMSAYSSIEGIGFAIPSATVKSVVDSLVENGEFRGRTSIGITLGTVPQTAAEHYDLPEGLYVSDVQKGTDAEAQGIKPGDIITAVNNIEVTTTQEVLEIKDKYKVGDSLTFSIWRDGTEFDVDVKLMDTNDVY